MAEIIVMMGIGGVVGGMWGLYKANKKIREETINEKRKLYNEWEKNKKAMNKLSIYEQEFIKRVELELAIDDFQNSKIEAYKKRMILENAPEYKEMLKNKYKN